MLHPLGRRPPDPRIPILQVERGAAEADRPQPAVLRADQVAQLSAHQPTLVQRMFPDHQFVPELAFVPRWSPRSVAARAPPRPGPEPRPPPAPGGAAASDSTSPRSGTSPGATSTSPAIPNPARPSSSCPPANRPWDRADPVADTPPAPVPHGCVTVGFASRDLTSAVFSGCRRICWIERMRCIRPVYRTAGQMSRLFFRGKGRAWTPCGGA